MRYQLKLFIAGMSHNSIKAIENINAICHQYLADNYDLEVIDIYQQPQYAKEFDLIGIPTLVRQTPGPEKHIMGSLSETQKVVDLLEIDTNEHNASSHE